MTFPNRLIWHFSHQPLFHAATSDRILERRNMLDNKPIEEQAIRKTLFKELSIESELHILDALAVFHTNITINQATLERSALMLVTAINEAHSMDCSCNWLYTHDILKTQPDLPKGQP